LSFKLSSQGNLYDLEYCILVQVVNSDLFALLKKELSKNRFIFALVRNIGSGTFLD
jgi:hypothetical protein